MCGSKPRTRDFGFPVLAVLLLHTIPDYFSVCFRYVVCKFILTVSLPIIEKLSVITNLALHKTDKVPMQSINILMETIKTSNVP